MAATSESITARAAGREQAKGHPESSPLAEEVLDLFDQLRGRLLNYVLRFHPLTYHDGEEVVQEAFLALFQHLQKGRSRENLTGWLFRVVHNLGLKRAEMSRRSSQSMVELNGAVEHAIPDGRLNPEDTFAAGEKQRRLLAVVKALPEQEQRCLLLRSEGLRYRDIAHVLGISLGAVAKSLERSLARIARAGSRNG